ncbi:similar to Saccharomyces cerevisiae YOR161C PNS1 Protein of unknown function [Maudiozyma saulgeensis]|uniref:Protein PNS1 n=1 Tax=Maudiozyma saulgeensis TaxID=1789683 RepID=A0A1X7QYZ7_9SACH|nr:similar to Saccharomyces cerevisiae YOR161C PNS1 Protein of unknown function [Kazachstania saulgeensis]
MSTQMEGQDNVQDPTRPPIEPPLPAYIPPPNNAATSNHNQTISQDSTMANTVTNDTYYAQKYESPQNEGHDNNSQAPIVEEKMGSSFNETFPVEKPKFVLNDWPFIIIFGLTVCGFIVIAALTFRGWAQTYSTTGSGIYNSTNTGTPNTNFAIMLIFVCIISIVFSGLGLVLCRYYPRFFIIAGITVNILAALGTAIMYMSLHYWSAGIVFLIFTCFTAFCYWGMRSRIPFSVAVLKIIIDAMKVCPQTMIVGLIGGLIGSAFAFLFSMVIVATYIKYYPGTDNPACNVSGGSCSTSKLIGILVALFFCGYYISEVIRNVIHVSVSGIFGSWYYRYKSDQGMPRWPAMGALKRGLTTSFGSICFGSLIVALIDTLRQFLNLLRQSLRSNPNNSRWAGIFLLLIRGMVSVLKWLAQYFNHYAYSFIALYGKTYLNAAKETWHMIRYKGIDALINDSLINTALGFYALFVSYIATLFAFLYLRFTSPGYNSIGAFNGSFLAFSFVISLQICNIASEVIKSGVSTFFLALAYDPEVYQVTYPEQFDEIFRSYPQVLAKLVQNQEV